MAPCLTEKETAEALESNALPCGRVVRTFLKIFSTQKYLNGFSMLQISVKIRGAIISRPNLYSGDTRFQATFSWVGFTLYVPCTILQCVDEPTRSTTSYK